MKPITTINDPRYVKAMSHPLRVRILALLSERTASPVELSQWLDASLGVVAYHVRTLHRVGLIELVKETRVRGAVEHHYRANSRPVISDDAWEQASPLTKQAAVGSALQTIGAYAERSAAAGGFDRADAHLSRRMMRLDAQGWAELAGELARTLERSEEIERAAEERLAGDPHAGLNAGVVLMLFEAARLTGEHEPSGDGAAGRDVS